MLFIDLTTEMEPKEIPRIINDCSIYETGATVNRCQILRLKI